MSSLRDKFKKSKTIREFKEEIEGVGEVLFIEPALPEFRKVTEELMHYRTVIKKGKKGGSASSELILDDKKSNPDLYNKTLIVMCVHDPATKGKVFQSVEDLEEIVFGLDEKGLARNGKKLYSDLIKGVTSVIESKPITREDLDAKKKS